MIGKFSEKLLKDFIEGKYTRIEDVLSEDEIQQSQYMSGGAVVYGGPLTTAYQALVSGAKNILGLEKTYALPLLGRFVGPRYSGNRILSEGEVLSKVDVNVSPTDSFDAGAKIHDIEYSLASSIKDEARRNKFYVESDRIISERLKNEYPGVTDYAIHALELFLDVYSLYSSIKGVREANKAVSDFEKISKEISSAGGSRELVERELDIFRDVGRRNEELDRIFNSRRGNILSDMRRVGEAGMRYEEAIDIFEETSERVRYLTSKINNLNRINPSGDVEIEYKNHKIESALNKLQEKLIEQQNMRYNIGRTHSTLVKSMEKLNVDKITIGNEISNLEKRRYERIFDEFNKLSSGFVKSAAVSAPIAAVDELSKKEESGSDSYFDKAISFAKNIKTDAFFRRLAISLFGNRLKSEDSKYYTYLEHSPEQLSYLIDKVLEEGKEEDYNFVLGFLKEEGEFEKYKSYSDKYKYLNSALEYLKSSDVNITFPEFKSSEEIKMGSPQPPPSDLNPKIENPPPPTKGLEPGKSIGSEKIGGQEKEDEFDISDEDLYYALIVLI